MKNKTLNCLAFSFVIFFIFPGIGLTDSITTIQANGQSHNLAIYERDEFPPIIKSFNEALEHWKKNVRIKRCDFVISLFLNKYGGLFGGFCSLENKPYQEVMVCAHTGVGTLEIQPIEKLLDDGINDLAKFTTSCGG